MIEPTSFQNPSSCPGANGSCTRSGRDISGRAAQQFRNSSAQPFDRGQMTDSMDRTVQNLANEISDPSMKRGRGRGRGGSASAGASGQFQNASRGQQEESPQSRTETVAESEYSFDEQITVQQTEMASPETDDGRTIYNDESVLTTGESETLAWMREEEKLARDVYKTLYEQWGLPVFSNISESEQRHTDRVDEKLDAYGITDPVTDDTIGVFQNPEISALYDELVSRGQNSLDDALKVGAFIEELDIRDLQNAIAESEQDDIDGMYQNLMNGSYNHLQAFVGQIEKRGTDYQAQYMSQSEVETILSDTGQGRGRGGGRNRG